MECKVCDLTIGVLVEQRRDYSSFKCSEVISQLTVNFNLTTSTFNLKNIKILIEFCPDFTA